MSDELTHEVILERTLIRARRYIATKDFRAMKDIRFDAHWPLDMDALACSLMGWIYGETPQSYSVTYPASWIDAVKDKWLPKRYRHHWPVRYKTFSVRADLVYKDFKVQMPDEPHKVFLSPPMRLTKTDPPTPEEDY